ncbi:hypothetical protein [Cetobacterium sp.]|uniref:hypothetical protein n=1 Tax=Cetobacterium sp. TaxID=2071632 RepID=UPI003F2DD13C
MKKIFLFVCLVQLLGCNTPEKSSPEIKSKNTFIGVSQDVTKIETQILELYKEVKGIQYKFNGNMSNDVVSYVTGKNLVIPIIPTKLEDADYLSLGLIMDLEKKTEMVILDGLRIDYLEFKKIIDTANEWIAKSSGFRAENPLEIPLVDKIYIEFPQSKEPRAFEGTMIFSDGTRGREVLLKEIGDPKDETLVNLSLKRDHILHLANGLSNLYIQGAIAENYQNIQQEIDRVKTQYTELKTIIK